MSEHFAHPIPPPVFNSPFGSEISTAPSDMASIEEAQQRIEALSAEIAQLKAAADANADKPQVFGKPPRIPDPAQFNGNSNDVDRFVDQARFWTGPCPNDDACIRLTASRLTGHAAAWNLRYGTDHTVYDEYLTALATYFQDPRRHENAVRQLIELKQGKSVADYNRSFTSIGLRFGADRRWPEPVLIDIYLNGLNGAVRSHVEATQRPTTLEAAQRAAIVAAGEQPSGGRPAGQPKYGGKQPQQQRQQQHNGPTPMEIGAVERSKQQQPQRQPPQGNKPWPPPHPPNTPCPVCNKGKHWAVDCPVAKAAASN